MPQAFLSAFSDFRPDRTLRRAIRVLASRLDVRSLSTVYLTGTGRTESRNACYTCVIEIETALSPGELERILPLLSQEAGRTRGGQEAALRQADLALILYDRLALAEGSLILPHPDILRNPVLIMALNELAPDLVLPGTCVAVASVAKNLRLLKPLAAFTALLQRDLRSRFKTRVTAHGPETIAR